MNVVLAGHVLVQEGSNALTVAHLAEDATVWRGQTLDGPEGVVRIEMDIRRRLSFQIRAREIGY